MSSVDGSFAVPSFKITKRGEAVKSSMLELIVSYPSIVRTVKNKEGNDGVDLTLIIEKIKTDKHSENDGQKILDISITDFYDQPSLLNDNRVENSEVPINFGNFVPKTFVSLLYHLKNMDINIAKGIAEDKISSLGSVLIYAARSTLVITDQVEYVESIYNLLNSLDKEIPQVIIEIKVVELSADNKFRFGLDWQWGEKVSNATANPDITTYGGQGSFSSSDSVSDARGTSVMLQTLTGSVYSKFWASLETLAKDGKAEIEARPKVVVLNNEKAVFTSGESYPYRKEFYDTTNSKNYFVNALMPTGITLTVIPRIKDKDLIVLEISSDISNIIGYDGKYDMPVLSTRSTNTIVRIQDGDTLLLGGLFRKEKREQEYGIPLLKDIPLIGFLFKIFQTEDRKTEVLITLTPKILKN
jgi:type II secretory pathway component GspD/PulD (secretin)